MKATHKGICQACGSLQKLPSGKVSNHGYTREDGYFEGTCRGSKELPLELSCEFVKVTIVEATNFIDGLNNTIKALETNKEYGIFEGSRFELTPEFIAKPMLKSGKYSMFANAFGIYGTTKEELIDSLNKAEIKRLNSKINRVNHYIDSQNKTVSSWELKELKSI
jgi:hypothetical protein